MGHFQKISLFLSTYRMLKIYFDTKALIVQSCLNKSSHYFWVGTGPVFNITRSICDNFLVPVDCTEYNGKGYIFILIQLSIGNISNSCFHLKSRFDIIFENLPLIVGPSDPKFCQWRSPLFVVTLQAYILCFHSQLTNPSTPPF
jgi:hypothetical protein